MQERIAVIGLGYVGLPVALAFARKFPGTDRVRRQQGEGRGAAPRLRSQPGGA